VTQPGQEFHFQFTVIKL